MKKKVTLSIDSKIYSDFQKFCEKNAIMLSKKVELIMNDIMQDNKDIKAVVGNKTGVKNG